MQIRLRVVHSAANLREVIIDKETVIGRQLDCGLRIASVQVSRRHCRLTPQPNALLIEDLNSSNGTLVDGRTLPPRQRVLLQPGSQLSIGPVKFVVEYLNDVDRPVATPLTVDDTLNSLETLAEMSLIPADRPQPETATSVVAKPSSGWRSLWS